MITSSFDPSTAPIFGPQDLYTPGEKIADVCVITFSKTVIDHALERIRQSLAPSPGRWS